MYSGSDTLFPRRGATMGAEVIVAASGRLYTGVRKRVWTHLNLGPDLYVHLPKKHVLTTSSI
jgi:hypothetical protein